MVVVLLLHKGAGTGSFGCTDLFNTIKMVQLPKNKTSFSHLCFQSLMCVCVCAQQQHHHGGVRRPTDEERSGKPSVSAGNQQREIFHHRH